MIQNSTNNAFGVDANWCPLRRCWSYGGNVRQGQRAVLGAARWLRSHWAGAGLAHRYKLVGTWIGAAAT